MVCLPPAAGSSPVLCASKRLHLNLCCVISFHSPCVVATRDTLLSDVRATVGSGYSLNPRWFLHRFCAGSGSPSSEDARRHNCSPPRRLLHALPPLSIFFYPASVMKFPLYLCIIFFSWSHPLIFLLPFFI